MALAVAAGEAAAFPLNGDGSAVRELVHVADVADAFLLALAAVQPGEHLAVNVSGGVGISVRDLLATIERITGRPVPVDHRPPVREARKVVADIGLAKRALGWRPTRSGVDDIVRDAWAATRSGELKRPL
jgi:UDP-glucose 4-epimerase